jgi:addiction module RelE/StbE family toxin
MEIVWRAVALASLQRARSCIAEDNPGAAERIYERILGAVRGLGDMPNMGRSGRVSGTGELIVSGTPYIVVYTVFENQIVIIAVQHGAQKWPPRF